MKLEKKIGQLRLIKSHLDLHECDPLLAEDYEETVQELNQEYGGTMNEILFDLYDEYFEDDEIQPFLNYLTDHGVKVDGEDFPGIQVRLSLKLSPLRFEVIRETDSHQEVIWQAA